MEPAAAAVSSSAKSGGSGKRIILACALGNFVEWFDFTLYGFSAVVLAEVFFPPDDSAAALLATFAVYGVAFVARPLGAAFFGWLGDRVGRRTSLSTSIVLMGAATIAIGLLPGWAVIGLGAPALLLVCRLAQGFSAGGEYTGAVTFAAEHAPAERRGLWLGLIGSSTWVGVAGATVTVVAFQRLAGDEFASGGWRWPFIVAGLVALVGLYLRLRVAETPVFAELEARAATRPEQARQPLRELLRGHSRTLVVLFVYFASVGVLTHMYLGYLPTYLGLAAGISSSTGLMITTGLALLAALLSPLAGLLTDRVGRRPLLRGSAVGGVLVVIPAYLLIGTGNLATAAVGLFAMQLVVSLLGLSGVLAVLEMYPASVRFSGMALPYNLAYALFAGTAPVVSQLLVQGTGDLLAPAYYATAVTLLALPVLMLAIPETRGADLRTGMLVAERTKRGDA